MKFLVSHDRQLSPLLRQLMIAVLIGIAVYDAMDVMLHALTFGISPQDVLKTVYGDEADFVEPILSQTLLMQVHIDLFLGLFVVLTLSAMAVRLLETGRMKRLVIHMLDLFGLLTPLVLLLAYFSHAMLILVWYGAFLFWHLWVSGVVFVLIKKVMQ